jgi:hypothetical protein
MGATCSNLEQFKNEHRRFARGQHQIFSSSRRRPSGNTVADTKKNNIAMVNYALQSEDEDEDVDEGNRLPKFARDLIKNLDEEEEKVDGDDVDPILLTKIRSDSETYTFVRENGTKQLFRASSLIDYMISTQHFSDPETRIPFTDLQLKKLDEIGAKLGKASLLDSKIESDWMKQKFNDEEDAFAGVERCAGENVYEMLRLVETTKKSRVQDGEFELLVRIFPAFRYHVSLMYGLKPEETAVAVDQYKRFLAGPPNRPTVDRSKVLLKYCLDFLDEVVRDVFVA